MNDMTSNGTEKQPTCCEENRKEISTLHSRVFWLLVEVNGINDKLTAYSTEMCNLEHRIAYLELPWWKKLWK